MLNNDSLNQLKQLKTSLDAQKETCEGVVKGTQHRYGFLVVSAKRQLFIPPDEMLKVFPQDKIQVVVRKDKKGKDFAEIEKLISSDLKQFVGRYIVKGTAHFVEPDIPQLSRWIFIPPKNRANAEHGDYIHCEIMRHPYKTGKPQAKVLEVIGKETTPGIETLFTACKYNLHQSWPEEVEAQLASSLEEVLKTHVAGREDLSELPFVTIDAPSTLDMDDALYAEELDEGWRLWVAIADPTAVIEEGSPIELEASQRATSAYLPGKRISMLPEVVSHHFCSLVANQMRLATACKMDISPSGEITKYEFTEAVICSKAKLSYQVVAEHLESPNKSSLLDNLPGIVPGINTLAKIQTALNNHRREHSLLGDDNTDYRLILNENKRIDSIEKIERNAAHKLVEECMVAANRCAADFLKGYEGSGIYITHKGFRKERLKDVNRIVKEQLPEYEAGELDQLAPFCNLINKVEKEETELPLRAILSRIFERSQLSVEPSPHFGMGVELYTTFTSPIRKFSDFLIQRAIKSVLAGGDIVKQDPDLIESMQNQLNTVRKTSNEIEQRLKCHFIKNKTDEIYSAKICQVNSSSITVRLDDNGIEGQVIIKELKGKYRYDPLYLAHNCKDISLRLDTKLHVKLSEVDDAQLKILFSIVDTPSATPEDSTPSTDS